MQCRATEMSDTSHVHDLRAGGCELPIPTWQGPFAYSRPAASWAGSYRLLIVTVDLTYGQYSCWSTLRVEHPSSRLFCFFLWVLTCFLLSDQHTHTRTYNFSWSVSSWAQVGLVWTIRLHLCVVYLPVWLSGLVCVCLCMCYMIVHACLYVCVSYVYMDVNVSSCVCAHVCLSVCMHAHVFAQMHVCAHVHMCMCSYTNTCICLCMSMPISSIFLFCTHIMHLFISLSLNTLTTRKSNSWHFLYPFHLGLLSCGNCHSWEPHTHRFWVLP